MTMENLAPMILMVIFAVIAFCVYFFPAIVASARRHRNTSAILVANLFFGWSGIGWLICLVWSCTADVEKS
jgi:uncharacterized membrane protein YsdA (DUF1294 family)